MALPNGNYRILKWGPSGLSEVLTLNEDRQITILPPDAAYERGQKVTYMILQWSALSLTIPSSGALRT